MSRSLLRQILLKQNLKPANLDPTNPEQPDDILLYIGKTNNASPLRISIEEIEPSETTTIMVPTFLEDFNNPTLFVENSYQNLISAKACLDNWVNETPSCVGAVHEAHVYADVLWDGVFPLELEINGDIIVFPRYTLLDDFLDIIGEYGLQVLPTRAELE